MTKKHWWRLAAEYLLIILGSALVGVGFDVFLMANNISGGGLSGLALLFGHVTGINAIGTVVLILNIPLFLMGWKSIGRQFFVRSLVGMVATSVFLDVCVYLPPIQAEPLLAALFGGIIMGLGLGVVFLQDASTGGTDIVARLMKRKMRNAPIGKLMFAFDTVVILLTGVVFQDINKTMYSAVALYVSTAALDMVIYGRNDSGVALIISDHYEEITRVVGQKLERGATLIEAAGAYTHNPKKVVLCAVKAQQVAQLQAVVSEIDPDAFLIMQKARQVLGEGFGRYSENSL